MSLQHARTALVLLSVSLSAISTSCPPAFGGLKLPSSNINQNGISLLAPGPDTAVSTDNTSQYQLTIPSLWWAKEQFGGKLLDNWLIYPTGGTTAPQIDLVVNQQIWTLLDYLERYEFINHFGTVARDYGYNLRVVNHQKELLATYTCDFSTNPQMCTINNLEAIGQAGVRRATEREQ